jgi:phage shock protein E
MAAFSELPEIRSMLFSTDGAVIIDCRDPNEIEGNADAISGHINIPWNSIKVYESRLLNFDSIIGGKDVTVLIYCRSGRRAGFFQSLLQTKGGYSRVFNTENSKRMHEACPELELTNAPNLLTPYACSDDIRALVARGARLVDNRDPDEIEKTGDAVEGHINIPWSSYKQFESLLEYFEEILGPKDAPVIVYCRSGKRSALFKAALEKHCGFSNVFNGENPSRILGACANLLGVSQPQTLSPFPSVDQIRRLLSAGAVIVDAREPEEIERLGDAFEGHVNIPASSVASVQSRLAFSSNIIGPKAGLVVVHCMRGRRAAAVKEALEQRCAYIRVFNGENPQRIHSAAPSLAQTTVANTVSPFASAEEIRELVAAKAVIIDAREPEEIEDRKDAVSGHVNIPWTSFGRYLSRLSQSTDILGPKESPVIVYCASGRRASMFKEALEQTCGYTNVFNCQNSARVRAACEGMDVSSSVNEASHRPSTADVRRALLPLASSILVPESEKPLIIDCREPEEITADGDAIDGHVNIPWSTFSSGGRALFESSSLYLPSGKPTFSSNKKRPIVIYCLKGWRSEKLKDDLISLGYTNVYNVGDSRTILNACPELKLTAVANSY